jgi:hypothetical protein
MDRRSARAEPQCREFPEAHGSSAPRDCWAWATDHTPLPTSAGARRWCILSSDPGAFGIRDRSGCPWADETATAVYYRGAQSEPPRHQGRVVPPLIGGNEAFSSMAGDLGTAIELGSGLPASQHEQAHIVGWLVYPLRDLSKKNVWGTSPWSMRERLTTSHFPGGWNLCVRLRHRTNLSSVRSNCRYRRDAIDSDDDFLPQNRLSRRLGSPVAEVQALSIEYRSSALSASPASAEWPAQHAQSRLMEELCPALISGPS